MDAVNLRRLDPRHDGEAVARAKVQRRAGRDAQARTESIEGKSAANLALRKSNVRQRRRVVAHRIIPVALARPQRHQARRMRARQTARRNGNSADRTCLESHFPETGFDGKF